jgi:hypothetical protein
MPVKTCGQEKKSEKETLQRADVAEHSPKE